MPTLGVIELENSPLRLPGSIGDAASFDHPVLYDRADGAWLERVVAQDPQVESAYAASARRLRALGADAVIASCGLALPFQTAIAGAVDVPAAASPLLLLPLIRRLMGPGSVIAILTFDTPALERLTLSNHRPADALTRPYGLEGTPLYDELSAPAPEVELGSIVDALKGSMDRAAADLPDLAAFLVECSAFLPARPLVAPPRDLPVFDHRTLAALLMAGVPTAARTRR